MRGSLPSAVLSVIESYDTASGCYRREDGSLDPCHTEVETLESWRGLLGCIKPRVVVETGVYYGLSTCFIAAALRDSGVPGARVYSIDPWQLEHYWRNSDLEPFIEYLPMTTQDAAPKIAELDIDVLLIDSIHTYDQASWELMTLEPQVREGGYIIMHDSLFFDGVGRAAQHLCSSPRFEVLTFETARTMSVPTVDRPVPMGCTVARKVRHGPPIEQDPTWLGRPEAIPDGPLPFLRIQSLKASGEPNVDTAEFERVDTLTKSGNGATRAACDDDWTNPACNASGRGGSVLPKSLLDSIQTSHFNYTYRGIPTYKNPFDWTLYPFMLWEQRPATIIEVGSNQGGSALWMADTMRTYGFPIHVHSIDINLVDKQLEGVTFHQGDAHHLENHFSPEFLEKLPRPWLVIEDSLHEKPTSLAVLNFFHPWLRSGEYIVIEDGIITDMAGPECCDGGPRRAVEEWLSEHGREYQVDARYCDWFGQNVTWNVNGFLKRK